MAGNIVPMPFIAVATKRIRNKIMMCRRTTVHLRDCFIVLFCFSSVLLDASEQDLISACFTMGVCHKDIPVFFLFSGAASISSITYHAFIFVKTFGKSRGLDLFSPLGHFCCNFYCHWGNIWYKSLMTFHLIGYHQIYSLQGSMSQPWCGLIISALILMCLPLISPIQNWVMAHLCFVQTFSRNWALKQM